MPFCFSGSSGNSPVTASRNASNVRGSQGGVAEWSIAAVLKTAGPQGPVGSNPTPSARIRTADHLVSGGMRTQFDCPARSAFPLAKPFRRLAHRANNPTPSARIRAADHLVPCGMRNQFDCPARSAFPIPKPLRRMAHRATNPTPSSTTAQRIHIVPARC